MSTITLEMLLDAATTTLPDASPAEQGELVAALVKKFDAELTVKTEPKPATIARKPARKASAKKAATKANWQGYQMKSAKGTATPKQVERLVNLGVKPATAKAMSMVAASDKYAALKGRI